MFGIGKDKWLQYSFAGSPLRIDPKSDLEVVITKKADTSMSFHDARRLVAEDIVSIAKHKKIFVGLSGGLDSEIVAQSFYEQGIEIYPIITDIKWYNIHVNYSDTWYAYRWCNERNIKPIVFNYSIGELLSESLRLAKQLRTRKLYPLLNVINSQFAKSQGGLLVNGQALIEYYPEHTLDYIRDMQGLSEGWLIHECDFYVDMEDPGYHPYNFLSWTPEIVLSIISARDFNLNSEDNKANLTGLLPRPKLGMPDLVLHYYHESMAKQRQQYGTSEVFHFGTHNNLIKLLS